MEKYKHITTINVSNYIFVYPSDVHANSHPQHSVTRRGGGEWEGLMEPIPAFSICCSISKLIFPSVETLGCS